MSGKNAVCQLVLISLESRPAKFIPWAVVRKSNVRLGSITNRSITDGNPTFDCVRLAKFSCEFDYVRLSSAIEPLVFSGFYCRTVRLDRSGLLQ